MLNSPLCSRHVFFFLQRFWKPFSDHLVALSCALSVDPHSVCQCNEEGIPEKGLRLMDAAAPAAAAAVKRTSKRDAASSSAGSEAEKLRTAAAISWDLIKAKYEWQEEYNRAVSIGYELPAPVKVSTGVTTLEDEFKRQNGRPPTHMWTQMWD